MSDTHADTAKLKPLNGITHPCPRGYETATGTWEESGVDDHCAGCGCKFNAHYIETRRQVSEQVVLDKNGIMPAQKSEGDE